MQRSSPDLTVFELGSEEWAALPDLDVPAVLVKIDTGARTSALHATRIETYAGAEGPRVRFVVHPVAGRADIARSCDLPLVARRWITSSNGARELRCVVATTIRVGERQWPIDVSLTNRRSMRFRMLLGRRAIADDMVVVPSQSCLQRNLSYGVYDEHTGPPARKTRRAVGLRIGLLGEGPIGPVWQQLADAALLRGHLIERVDTRDCQLVLSARQAIIEHNGSGVPRLDGVIALAGPRRDQPAAAFTVALVSHLEHTGCVAINSANALAVVLDAVAAHQVLHARQIPLAAAAITIAGPAFHPPRSRTQRLAALVVSGRVVASARRIKARSGARTDQERFGPVTLIASERRLVLAAAQAIGLGFVRVDLARRADGTVVVATVTTEAGQLERLLSLARASAGALVIKTIEERVRAAAAPVEG
jgi:hypothetical protein